MTKTHSTTYSRHFKQYIKRGKNNNTLKGNYNKWRLKEEHKQWIEGYFEQHRLPRTTVSKLRNQLLLEFPSFTSISKTAITRWLKKELKMVYKNAIKKSAKTLSVERIRNVFENVWLQTKINEDGIEIIYIDEFKVSTKHNDLWGWTKQGKRGYISFDPNFFHMSFIWAVSKYKVYGIWGFEVTLCSDGFHYFIE